MYRDYDIFEVLPNGSKVRVASLHGLELALMRLERVAKVTSNECLVADAKTRQIVAQKNVPVAKGRRIKLVFQIAYDERLGNQRSEVLRSSGYRVISAIGNEKAKILLSAAYPYSLFIVGHKAKESTRSEMVDWLKANYPNAKLLALNSPDQELSDANYNVVLDGSETWLSIAAQHLADGATA